MSGNLKELRESSSRFLMHELPVESLRFHSNKYKGREKILKGVIQSTLRHFRTKKHLNPNTCFDGFQLMGVLGRFM